MDLETAINATVKEYAQRSHNTMETMLAEQQPGSQQPSAPAFVPVDHYNQAQLNRINTTPRSSYGTRPYTRAILRQLEASPIKQAFQKAKAEIEVLERSGDKQRADLVRQQYMEDYYMPAVDAAVRLGSKQDVLSSQEILKTLDDLAILQGKIRGTGYTASLVGSLYEEGEAPTVSDVDVEDAVRKITEYCNNGNVGVAIGLAKRIKGQIDNGENVAVPEDYELIEKVALRG